MLERREGPLRAGAVWPWIAAWIAAWLGLSVVGCGDGAASAPEAPDPRSEVRAPADGGARDAGADARDASFGVPGDGDGLEWGSVLFDDAVSVAGDPAGTCRVDRTGSVWCKGDNEYGQLGTGVLGGINGAQRTTEVESKVLRIDDAVAVVATGTRQRCALTRAGSLMCWGEVGADLSLEPVALGPPSGAGRARVVRMVRNGTLLVGVGLLTDTDQVCLLSGAGTRCSKVAQGAVDFAMTARGLYVLDRGGSVFSCSIGNDSASCTKLALPSSATSLVSYGSQFDGFTSLAVLDDGRVACWNSCPLNAPKGLSDVPESAPLTIPGLDHVERLVSGTCTVDTDDTVRCWGQPVRRRDTTPYSRPERIGTLPGLQAIVGTEFGGLPTLGLTTDGQVRAITWP